MALQDAWELAQQLVNGKHSSVQAAISEFSEKAAPRSVDAIDRSHKIIGVLHCKGLLKLLAAALISFFGFIIRFARGSAALRWNQLWNFAPQDLLGSKQEHNAGAAQKLD